MKNKEFYCNIKISIHKENYSLSKLKTCYEKQQQQNYQIYLLINSLPSPLEGKL